MERQRRRVRRQGRGAATAAGATAGEHLEVRQLGRTPPGVAGEREPDVPAAGAGRQDLKAHLRRGVALDESGDFGVYARMHAQGDAKAAYQLKVYPAFRSWRLRREAWATKTTHVSSIVDWEFSPLIGGVGTINEVELRFSDSVFQVVLNGQTAATVVDAASGFATGPSLVPVIVTVSVELDVAPCSSWMV